MAPRAPVVSGVDDDGDIAATKSSSSSVNNTKKDGDDDDVNTLVEQGIRKKGGLFRHTFHWELNFYCFLALGLMYQATPETHRIFWHVVYALLALDAARYYYRKGSTHGVPYTLPFVSLIAMIIRPVRFWEEMGYIAMESPDGMCSNLLGGVYMVFVSDAQLCRQIMTGEGTYRLYAHPNALWLFDPKNLIYMPTVEHKAFRAILTPALFSNDALELYAASQEKVVRQFLTRYQQECQTTGKPVDARIAFRSMAAASSQEAFLGPYLRDDMREQLEQDILTFTLGFLSFPFPYLNFGLQKAIQAKNRIENIIKDMVPQAHEYIAQGNVPRCLLEHWAASIQQAAKEQGVEHDQVLYCDDENLARTVLDFLFAAQDATNSALTYALDVLDAHRGVLERLRREVDQVCGKGSVARKIRDTHHAFKYTGLVATELLHHKPPVPMVPHIVLKPTTLAGHALAKGAVVIPSQIYSARTSGASRDFLPERPDRDTQFVKTVIFGAGQHKCPGRRYAESLLLVFLAVLAQDYDFARTGPRPELDEFIYFPTVFPTDCDFMLFERSRQ